MAALTALQVHELANNFLILANTLSTYRQENFDHLSESENAQLKDLHETVLNNVDDFYTLSATLVMDDVTEALSEISTVTLQINEAYKTLKNVQKAIDIAASAVTLGAAIMSKNPKAIAQSIGGLADTLKA